MITSKNNLRKIISILYLYIRIIFRFTVESALKTILSRQQRKYCNQRSILRNVYNTNFKQIVRRFRQLKSENNNCSSIAIHNDQLIFGVI